MENPKRAAAMARDGRIAVLQFHGVPDRDHPWVDTPRERFEEYMAWIHTEGYKVIAMRDLSRYVDPAKIPANPMENIERRKREIAAKAAAGAKP